MIQNSQKIIAELPGAAASVSQRFGRILNRGPYADRYLEWLDNASSLTQTSKKIAELLGLRPWTP